MTESIQAKVKEIGDFLFEHIQTEEIFNEKSNGIYTGKIGVLIFLSYYMKEAPTPLHKELFDKYLESSYEDISNGINSPTYCSGIAGILAGLRFLNQEGLLDVDFSEIESAYRSHLFNIMCGELQRGNYDFLHAALGIALYFKNDEEFVTAAVEILDNLAVHDGDKLKWRSHLSEELGFGYNISLSHGMSSIAAILCRFYENGFCQEKIAYLLTGCVNYILSQEIDHTVWGCFFPSMSSENEGAETHKSRLGWCYGDLCIATTLWQAGKTLNNQQWQDKATEVMLFSAQRRDLNDNQVFDAGICHGSAGIAMMFNRMYFNTGNPVFREAHDYWISITLRMDRFEDGYAGYKIFRAKQEETWQKEYSLLEGVSGIGMVLWSALQGKEENKWTDLFLL